jgi:hypothetical protein
MIDLLTLLNCVRLNELTGGESLRANLALVKKNALIGAQVAVQLANLKSTPSTLSSASTRTRTSTSFGAFPAPPGEEAGPVVVGGCNYDIVMRVDEDIRMDGSTHCGSLQFRLVNRITCSPIIFSMTQC